MITGVMFEIDGFISSSVDYCNALFSHLAKEVPIIPIAAFPLLSSALVVSNHWFYFKMNIVQGK